MAFSLSLRGTSVGRALPVKPRLVKFSINGEERSVGIGYSAGFYELCHMAGEGDQATVVWSKRILSEGGIFTIKGALHPDQSIVIEDGMVFTIMETGSA